MARHCLGLLLLAVIAFPACRTSEPPPSIRATGLAVPVPSAGAPQLSSASAEQTPPSPAPAEPVHEPPAPAVVERIAVPGDSAASVVRGPGGAGGSPPRIVFMPGLCSNAYAYLLAFPEAARAHGGVVAIDGDLPCGAPNSGFRSFSWDPVRQRARLEKALGAAGVTTIPREGLTLVGYSAGAGIGELMVQRWPERYARVVLIGSPSDPSTTHLAEARGVVTMSCSRDVPGRMKDAARRLTAKGVPASYVEMPGCTHGNITEGDRVFDTAFDWLAENARAPKEDARELALDTR
jgi:pimeloyl-ACP methyl ester carboxylesterase